MATDDANCYSTVSLSLNLATVTLNRPSWCFHLGAKFRKLAARGKETCETAQILQREQFLCSAADTDRGGSERQADVKKRMKGITNNVKETKKGKEKSEYCISVSCSIDVTINKSSK
jgi:hypothetical protein